MPREGSFGREIRNVLNESKIVYGTGCNIRYLVLSYRRKSWHAYSIRERVQEDLYTTGNQHTISGSA